MNVDIYIREKNGSREIRVPVLPEHIMVEFGEGRFVTFDILGKGEVAEPTGVGLASISWQSEFPGNYRTDTSMIRGKRKTPSTYHQILESWKQKGTPLNLLVTGFPINYDVYVSNYTADISGAFGDVPYEIFFKQNKDITITKTTVKKSSTKTTTKRATKKETKYTIKSGDTLWGIAKKFLGSGTKWELIYNANKAIIEKTAKDNGRSSSQNGHWIYPGVTLTIPNADGTIPYINETATGAFGTVSKLTTLKGDTLAHDHYNNSSGDQDYPYKNVGLGSNLKNQTDFDTYWEIVAGKYDITKGSYVSIEAYNKPGLYVSYGATKAFLSQDADGKQAVAQTFKTVMGLAGEGVSFACIGNPGMYLSVVDGKATLTDGTDPECCTFRIDTVKNP